MVIGILFCTLAIKVGARGREQGARSRDYLQ